MSEDSRVVVVMPASNAAETLSDTCKRISPDRLEKGILVDDGSIDGTVSGASELDLELIVHPQNAG